MDDVTKLFRTLVRHLATDDPTSLQAPFQISELYQSMVPYRHFKRELGFDSIEDYEMAILKLLAGSGGLATLDPPDVQQVLMTETEEIVPNTGAFREFAAVRVILSPEAVQACLDEATAYAPPAPAPVPSAPSVPTAPPPQGAEEISADPPEVVEPSETAAGLVFEPVTATECCDRCGKELPRGHTANFCPFCGNRLLPGSCRHCGDPVEPDWRFCLICGTPVDARHR